MSTYVPQMFAPSQLPVPPVAAVGPKLSYEVGESCWIFAGLRDKKGNHQYSAGRVVYWFDLPDLAQRYYVIRILEKDFMHLMTRDSCVMSPTADGKFPFERTRHDEIVRPEPVVVDWRTS